MKITQILTLSIPKVADDGGIFDPVLEVLSKAGYDSSGIRICFEDFSSGFRKTSSVERVLKAFPALQPYQGHLLGKEGERTSVVLASSIIDGFMSGVRLDLPHADSQQPIDTKLLAEILHGVPKRFPFWHVHVFFSGISALNMAGLAPEDFSAGWAPGVLFDSHWWTSKRMRNLTATLTLPVPENGQGLTVPAETRKLLAALGKVSSVRTFIEPAAENRVEVEKLIDEGRRVAKQFSANPFAERPDARLPHDLPMVEPGKSFGVPLSERKVQEIPSIKELLKKYFKPLGYRYNSKLSNSSGFTLLKRGVQNYELEFFAEASPRGGQFSSSLIVRTVFAQFNVDISLPSLGKDYPINEDIEKLIVNTAYAVRVLEETFVSKIESLFGPAPAWFYSIQSDNFYKT